MDPHKSGHEACGDTRRGRIMWTTLELVPQVLSRSQHHSCGASHKGRHPVTILCPVQWPWRGSPAWGGELHSVRYRFGYPQLAHHKKEFDTSAMPTVALVIEGYPFCRLAQEGVPVMGLMRQDTQAVSISVRERCTQGGLVVLEPRLCQGLHRLGRLRPPEVHGALAKALAKVLYRP